MTPFTDLVNFHISHVTRYSEWSTISIPALRSNGGEVTIKLFSNERANFSHWTTSDQLIRR
jgi:hypothetical protein